MFKIIKKITLKTFYKIYSYNSFLGRTYLILLLFLRKQKRKIRLSKKMNESTLILKYFESIKQKGGVLFDVGASTGSFFERFLGSEKDWKIYAFDPDPDKMKQEALKYFSRKENVEFIHKACSNKSGEKLQFFASEVSTGISSLHAFHSSHHKTGDVETITLSDFILNSQIDSIDILKIDTEGHDLFVLQGFPWDALKPKVIFCEFENRKTIALGYDFQKLGDYFIEKGYHVFVSEWFPVVEYGTTHKWREIKSYPTKLEDENAFGNFICFRDKFMDNDYLDFLFNSEID